MTIVASRNRGWLLLPIVYAFALINLALATFMPNEYITHLEATPGMLVHIGLSLFSYATLIIAALYALQLAWIDYQLKNKKLAFNQEMPPLMSIERKMFHITQIGVVLLTLTLCTGLFYMHNLFSMENIDKAVLSIVACLSILCCCGGVRARRRGFGSPSSPLTLGERSCAFACSAIRLNRKSLAHTKECESSEEDRKSVV